MTWVCRLSLLPFLISPPTLLCLSDKDFADYRGKLESIMEPSSVPTLGFSLSVFIFSRKPSDQGSVGCSPERIFSDKKNHEACRKILQCKNSICHHWMQHYLNPEGQLLYFWWSEEPANYFTTNTYGSDSRCILFRTMFIHKYNKYTRAFSGEGRKEKLLHGHW